MWSPGVRCLAFLIFMQAALSYTVVKESNTLLYETEGRGDNSEFKVVCYYNFGSIPFNGTLPANLNATLCTHIIAYVSGINNGQVYIDPTFAQQHFAALLFLKKLNPSLKILACNVGSFSEVLASEENRTRFAKSAPPVLRKYGFDGMDLDWEFPAYRPDWYKPAQKHNFTLVVQALWTEFEQEANSSGRPRLVLTAAVAAVGIIVDFSYEIDKLAGFTEDQHQESETDFGCDLLTVALRTEFEQETNSSGKPRLVLTAAVVGVGIMVAFSYEIDKLAGSLDWVNLMTYDIHSFLDTTPLTGYNSPLFASDTFLGRTIFKDFNLAWAANDWVKKGMKKSQVMVGAPLYGHTFELLDAADHGVYSFATGHGPVDEIPYPTICKIVQDPASHTVWDNSSMVPYVYKDKLWVSYDNMDSLALKTKWILQENFGGVMVFSMNSDDCLGTCDGKTKWPLLTSINSVIKSHFKTTVVSEKQTTFIEELSYSHET